MKIIVNKQVPVQVIEVLNKYGEVLLFETTGITYPQVAGHPDLFFCAGDGKLVIAPNTPETYIENLRKSNVDFVLGKSLVGNRYPDTARFNAVITDKYLIHNLEITDPVIPEIFDNLETVNIPQGYGRCSLLPLKNDCFITSDKGVERVLKGKGCEVLFVDPSGIILPGFEHGFFGGTAGVTDNEVFFIGSLNRFNDGEKVKSFLQNLDYKIIELYDGPLFDGGSILFV